MKTLQVRIIILLTSNIPLIVCEDLGIPKATTCDSETSTLTSTLLLREAGPVGVVSSPPLSRFQRATGDHKALGIIYIRIHKWANNVKTSRCRQASAFWILRVVVDWIEGHKSQSDRRAEQFPTSQLSNQELALWSSRGIPEMGSQSPLVEIGWP